MSTKRRSGDVRTMVEVGSLASWGSHRMNSLTEILPMASIRYGMILYYIRRMMRWTGPESCIQRKDARCLKTNSGSVGRPIMLTHERGLGVDHFSNSIPK